MSDPEVRRFARSDRDQLTSLVNARPCGTGNDHFLPPPIPADALRGSEPSKCIIVGPG